MHQGCAGRPFFLQGWAGRGKVKISGAGRGEKASKSTNSQNFTKVRKRKI